MAGKGSNSLDPQIVPVDVPYKTLDLLRYIGRVDGTSVPAVVRKMIDNQLRIRKATDREFKSYAARSR